ncbi:MAG: hypothetical protein HKM07_03375 [Chlamydiae bacterium]|nr:hypothetical protein [Chlamydiota bacterium]
MNLFQKELHLFVEKEVQKAHPLEGISQPSKKKCLTALEKKDLTSSLEAYHEFLKERSSLQLEKLLEEDFPVDEFEKISLPARVIPYFYQKLPRNKNTDSGSVDEIKKNHAHLPSLKKHCIDKALLYLYENLHISMDKKVVILTWVMSDGLGDYVAQYEACKILKKALPEVDFYTVSLLSSSVRKQNLLFSEKAHHIYYKSEEDLHFSSFPQEVTHLLKASDLVLQIPTFYPHWNDLVKEYGRGSFETLGEYGFVNSHWAHPSAPKMRCMGLHFLEKGIFIKDMPVNPWDHIPSRLHSVLIKDGSVQEYLEKNIFVFAYLISFSGTYVFLHLLLSYFDSQEKDLDLGVTNLRWFLDLVKKGIFPFSDYGLKEVVFCFEEEEYSHIVGSNGKKLRIIDLSPLSLEESQVLCSMSWEIMACRGDQSFSEAVSANKLYFYDPPTHARPFLQDLIELAKNTIQEFPSSISFLEGFLQVTDEAHDLEKCKKLGKFLGKLLQNERTKKGIYKLSQTIQERYTVNSLLPALVKRALLHKSNPNIKEKEDYWIQKFLAQEISLSFCLQKIQEFLQEQ